MKDLEIQIAFEDLRRQSRVSLTLVLLGAVFLLSSGYYSISRLRPLEAEISVKRAQLATLAAEETMQRERVAELKASFDRLKSNTEGLYSVKVTPANQVYEVKATAMATGRKLSGDLPEYTFTVLINAPTETLNSIERVRYTMDHASFRIKDYVSTNMKNQFARSYVGWGCLSSVQVAVILKTGTTHTSEFDMCKSLGPQWQ